MTDFGSRFSIFIVLLLIVLSIASFASAASYIAPTPLEKVSLTKTGSIRIKVLDNDLGDSLNGANVSLFRNSDNAWIASANSVNGLATFQRIPMDSYTAYVQSPAYETTRLQIDLNVKKIRLNAVLVRMIRSPTQIASWDHSVQLQMYQIAQVKRKNSIQLQITYEAMASEPCSPDFGCTPLVSLKIDRGMRFERIALHVGESANVFGRAIQLISLDEQGNAVLSVYRKETEFVEVNPV